MSAASDVEDDDARWLASFHAGERQTIEAAYREHGSRVLAAARRLVGEVDAETVVHEVFYRLLANAKARAGFRGGNLGAWLSQVAANAAIDDLRRRRREESSGKLPEESLEIDGEVEARLLVERFRRERLPPELERVFEVRFLRQLPQREAAAELGVPRSTLVYQEQRVRELLERFLLNGTDA